MVSFKPLNDYGIKIDKGVDFESHDKPKPYVQKRNSKYPSDFMEVGDSFQFPETGESQVELMRKASSLVVNLNKKYSHDDESGETRVNRAGNTVPVRVQERRFVVRAYEGGARIWRVE